MKTSVIGYPRIGILRELKFASEKYFRSEIGAEELLQTAKELRKTHWLTQKMQGLIIFPVMIFPIMIWYWIQLLCLVLFQRDIRNCNCQN